MRRKRRCPRTSLFLCNLQILSKQERLIAPYLCGIPYIWTFVEWCQVLRQYALLDSSNTSRSVWADSAYRSEATEADLKAKGYRSQIHRKGTRGKALTAKEKQGNQTRSKTRCRVEHVFAWMAQWGAKSLRCIGLARAEVCIGMMNMVYNMRRFCTIRRVVAS